MTPERPQQRADDIKVRIRLIRRLLDGKSLNEVGADLVARAAFERFLEIISEASRHLPDDWKAEHPEIEWRRIADIGNVMRHVYSAVDLSILWAIYERDLDPLEAAIEAMLAAYGK
ncbi:MAG: HepT-like ribonuclease domain-containing protein [Bauldia sp.]